MYVSVLEWLPSPRPLHDDDLAFFAIGDIHGCADHLEALHTAILKQISGDEFCSSQAVQLGDYIDRGPDSLRTLEILADGMGEAVQDGYLVGNNDQFMIELLNLDPELDRLFIMNWYDNGGIATMESLGVYVFVHAGISPGPALEDQEFADLLLMREPFLSSSDEWPHPFCVVHGHSIAADEVHCTLV